MEQFAQQLINGLSWGAIYALIAVGYTMVYGVLRLINFAHGDVYMIGAMSGLIAATTGVALVTLPWWYNPVTMLAVALLVVFALKQIGTPGVRWRPFFWTLALLALALVAADLISRGIAPMRDWILQTREASGGGTFLSESAATLVLLLLIVVAMILCGSLGFVIEKVAYRPLRNQPRLTVLITAIGVSMFLEFGGQRFFGPNPQAFPTLILPRFLTTDFHVGGVIISVFDLFIFCLTIALMLVLGLIVMKTRTGMALRAVSFRFDTASLMGINTDRIISFTFILGSALAAVAGILVAGRYPKVDPLMGLMPGIKAFVAAVLGGIGNIPGAVAGGILLGLTETLVAGYLDSQYRDAVAFVILIGVLLIKPSGLFGKNVIEKV